MKTNLIILVCILLFSCSEEATTDADAVTPSDQNTSNRQATT